MLYSAQLILCLIFDWIFGDPRWYPHPVRGIGWLCSFYERFFRSHCKNLQIAGTMTVFSVIATTTGILTLLLSGARLLSPYFEQILAIVLIYMALSLRDLLVHSNNVYSALLSDEPLVRGRKEVAKIVGRDTAELSESEIAKACVETVGENMVDGSTSPLFYAVVGSLFSFFVPLTPIACSALGIFMYKAINTMDSMIGYKNDRYIYFGRTAAKLDDLVNFIPARISGICLVAAAFVQRLNWKNSAKIYFRDNDKHTSPNAAHPEAAVAGALDIQLGGPSRYFGKIVDKPFIGDPGGKIVPGHIKTVNRLVVTGTLLFFTMMLLTRSLFYLLTA
ncbi:adenosylcobinamide-phosphate synthase CbiB [Desulforhopalus sp. IMCC35007]|uniref:adenosylcobinamide-phosphate synthase CbiB n=1 Tax=Desulforhopalus sp. IMCC35007 TaxID=2569543 RepID=UPI0010AEB03F|nr:adenosylcobinamide-phosphate synthase CbiB [Desulforhopalus sp. IMCC35007]TKB11094.1 cobalamin biosynthesis protein CobD [Desulforhopalus sp. IMCC35007]